MLFSESSETRNRSRIPGVKSQCVLVGSDDIGLNNQSHAICINIKGLHST